MPGAEPAPWTLAAIKHRNLQLEAYCQVPGCGWFCSFDIDALIERAGPDYELPDGPGIDCGACGGTEVIFKLAFAHRQDGE